MKKVFRSSLAALLAFSMAACTKKAPEEEPVPDDSSSEEEQETEPAAVNPALNDASILHEQEFGGVYITSTIDDFNSLGFKYGDSVDVVFSNGYKLEDIPYYNGYYVDAGQPLLIAYPGYDYIKAAVNYGDDLWETANLKKVGFGTAQQEEKPDGLWLISGVEEHDTATVTLREAGKYKDIQDARDIHYYDERGRYDSDEMFANFRAMNCGNLKNNFFYRSASPCDNSHNRAPFTDNLMMTAGVSAILDLSDTEAKIENYLARADFSSLYFRHLYEQGTVYPIGLNMNYLSEEFGQKIAEGFVKLSQANGPYLVHCTEGKDRTGFVCMLVEMLAGASYQEIVKDYMLTYDNYYRINEQSDPARYKTILEKNLLAMMSFVAEVPAEELESTDLKSAAANYLYAHGMSEEDLSSFLARICN
jgi:predicted small lipoprotein YifL